MPNAGEANKAKRPRPEETTAGQPSKKSCDPKGEAAAPKAKDTALGKKTAKQVGPTEAQVRHAEIVKKARAEQAAQASLAAQAKAAKSPVPGLAASMPVLTPAEVLLNQLAGPIPAPIEPIQEIQPGPDDATDDDIEITGQRALTPDPDRPPQAAPNLPHLTKEQKASAIDLNFAWVLSDCLLYTSPSPRDRQKSRMPSSA